MVTRDASYLARSMTSAENFTSTIPLAGAQRLSGAMLQNPRTTHADNAMLYSSYIMNRPTPTIDTAGATHLARDLLSQHIYYNPHLAYNTAISMMYQNKNMTIGKPSSIRNRFLKKAFQRNSIPASGNLREDALMHGLVVPSATSSPSSAGYNNSASAYVGMNGSGYSNPSLQRQPTSVGSPPQISSPPLMPSTLRSSSVDKVVNYDMTSSVAMDSRLASMF